MPHVGFVFTVRSQILTGLIYGITTYDDGRRWKWAQTTLKQTTPIAQPESVTSPAPSRKAPTSSRKRKAPTTTPVQGPCIYHYPYHLQRSLEKIVVSNSGCLDSRHRRTGAGIHQIHELSQAKIAVSPTNHCGVRAVTIRGTNREVGDAIVAIGKGDDVRLWYSCQLLQ
jgi:hypothetical protein